MPTLHTDEGKVSQILRNFLSNALKFTERGEIRVSARPAAGDGGPDRLLGGGHRHRHRPRGSAAHLRGVRPARESGPAPGARAPGSACRWSPSWPTLLGGAVSRRQHARAWARPSPPCCRRDSRPSRSPRRPGSRRRGPVPLEPGQVPVLVVEDSAQDLLLYEHYFRGSRFHPVIARTLPDARRLHRPDPPGRAGPRHPSRGRGRLGLHRRGAGGATRRAGCRWSWSRASTTRPRDSRWAPTPTRSSRCTQPGCSAP